MEHYVLWELGQPAASRLFRERLWHQFRIKLDLWLEMMPAQTRMARAQQTDVISFGRRPMRAPPQLRIELKFWVRCVPCVRASCCR